MPASWVLDVGVPTLRRPLSRNFFLCPWLSLLLQARVPQTKHTPQHDRCFICADTRRGTAPRALSQGDFHLTKTQQTPASRRREEEERGQAVEVAWEPQNPALLRREGQAGRGSRFLSTCLIIHCFYFRERVHAPEVRLL